MIPTDQPGLPASCRDLGIVDISQVFAAHDQPLYIDAVHVTEQGNRLVASAMLPAVSEALKMGHPRR